MLRFIPFVVNLSNPQTTNKKSKYHDTSNTHISTYTLPFPNPLLISSPPHTGIIYTRGYLQSQLPLEQQVDLMTCRGQEEVLLHLEGLAGCLGRGNDFVFTQDGADVETQFEVCEVHSCAVARADGEGEEIGFHFGGLVVPSDVLA